LHHDHPAPAWDRSISQPTCESAPEEAQLTPPACALLRDDLRPPCSRETPDGVSNTIDALSRWMTGASSLNGSMLALRKNGV